MMHKRPSKTRGFDDKGWLQSYHTFSFDNYYDPENMNYHDLRVLNEDTIQGGKGLGSHDHKEVEIATLVLDGVLEHNDNLGNTVVIKPGDLHLLSAGSGIVHSEYNLSHAIPAHYLQLWFNPNQHNLDPSYAQKQFSDAAKWGQWCLLLSRNGREGSIRIHQDLDLYATMLDEGDQITFEALNDRYYWVQVIKGSFIIGDKEIAKGDALVIEDESDIVITCTEMGELLLLDLT